MKLTNNQTKFLDNVFAEFKSDLQKGNHDLLISGYDDELCRTTNTIPCHQLAVVAKSPFLAEVLKEVSDVEDVRIIMPGVDSDFVDSLFEVIYEPQWEKQHQALLESSGLCTPQTACNALEAHDSFDTLGAMDIKTEELEGDEAEGFDQVYLPCENESKVKTEEIDLPRVEEILSENSPATALAVSKFGDVTKKIFLDSLAKQTEPIKSVKNKPETAKVYSKKGAKKIKIPASHCSVKKTLKNGDKNVVVIKAPSIEEAKVPHHLNYQSQSTRISDHELDDVRGEVASVCPTCLKPFENESNHRCQFALDELLDYSIHAPKKLSFGLNSKAVSETNPLFLPLIMDGKAIKDFAVCRMCKWVAKVSDVKDSDFSHTCPPKNNCKTRDKIYQCDKCGKKYRHRYELVAHISSAHNNVRHMCEQCGAVLVSKHGLYEHVKKVHELSKEKTILCKTCGQMFRSRGTWKVHTMLHTGERPYKCEICGKGCIQIQNCKLHIKNAHGIKIPNGVSVKSFFKDYFEKHGRPKDTSEGGDEMNSASAKRPKRKGRSRSQESESSSALDSFDIDML